MHSFSVQFSSVAQLCLTLCDPMNCSTPGLPVHHHLPEFTQTHVHRVSDAIQPSHPRSSLSPPALKSLPASESFPMSQLFSWGGILFNGWVIFYCVYVPQLSYPFVCWWTSRLLPCPGYWNQCCDEQWGTRVSFDSETRMLLKGNRGYQHRPYSFILGQFWYLQWKSDRYLQK